MTSDIPECNRCGAHISWNKDRRAQLNTTRPLTLDNSKIHSCEEVTNNSSSNTTATTLDQQSHIQKIEEYSLTQVESLTRHTDLLVSIKGNTDLITQYLFTEKENTGLIAQYLRTIATIVKNIDEKLDSKLTEDISSVGGVRDV
ncbi:MAG: hypothetical protein L0H53_00485 [Candidatus Nitrosocosmicus sp.]|nr:hypothetical protein [Candidatus Nitrosocosmicus sp.]MDN5866013.1 hypothetical protein [Candidatus Nitrosocosmicus sp.]